MVKYLIEYSKTVKKDIKKIPRSDLQQIVEKIYKLSIDPRQSGIKKLSGTRDLYRARCGDYRIIYEIRDNELVVLVIKIGHRSDVYR